MQTNVIVTHDLSGELQRTVDALQPDRIFLLMDETTRRLCRPLVEQVPALKGAKEIVIGAGDRHKNLDTLAAVWRALDGGMATRHSLLVNLGGGMVTDLGGFAAATFKRGIAFVNLPTTVLAMVDASAGGKTGINFNGLKNEVGAFCDAQRVVIDTDFLRTLDEQNLRSGYAEMLKHGLISNDATWAELLRFDITQPNLQVLADMIGRSVQVKERIVAADPHEHGLRKALNLGHTVGHAFESYSLRSDHPLLHGYAVAYGLVCELYLSCRKEGFPRNKMHQTADFIRHAYGAFAFTCNDYEALYDLMQHDKKNEANSINFTLLADVGDLRLNCHATKEEIFEMFDFYREVTGL